ncbi:MAG: B12-binding domain-containing radical SAM protein [bacterium]|nr:B12-binding domain-containing radical SAM protein [bacterium]
MKLILVNVEDGIASSGFRRMAAHVKGYHPETSSRYVIPGRNVLYERVFPSEPWGSINRFSEDVADQLTGADIVGFSSVTMRAKAVEEIISFLRIKSPQTFIIWGGAHSMMAPDSAIEHADAVCIGEGESAFEQFLDAYRHERDYFQTPNFWFRREHDVVRNTSLPLFSSAEMDRLPAPEYAVPEEMIFEHDSGFVPMTLRHYLRFNGLSYHTIWSIGCPFSCTYCGNTRYVKNNPGYRKIRYTAPSSLMKELRQVIKRHPHIRSIIFDDDSFMALPTETIEEFCQQYKQEIGIPFTVTGVIPNYIHERKLELLVNAGLMRVRMGIQSGSDRILEFYKRPSPRKKVMRAAEIINRFDRHMMPPDYDIIVDNPIETGADVRDTLQLVHDLPRPFHLNLFSLTVMPNTVLECQLDEMGVELKDASHSYQRLAPTLANATLYLLCLVKPPRWLMNRLISKARPFTEKQRFYPYFCSFLRFLWILRRSAQHFLVMGFVNSPGALAYLLYRSRIVDLRLHLRSFLGPHQPPKE